MEISRSREYFCSTITSQRLSSSANSTIKYTLSSDSAWANYKKNIAFLESNVILHIDNVNTLDGANYVSNSSNITNNALDIFASQVLVNINSGLFSSNELFHAQMAQDTLSGKGFAYDYNRGILHVLSQVRIRYVMSK
jgi:lipopolysaccharide export system protein LptC